MQSQPTKTLPDLEKATVSEIEEALVHFDEFDAPSLERLSADPVHGRRLALLREADGWLREAAPQELAVGLCPSSEDLYDFGGGPGSSTLPDEVAERIGEHVSSCESCAEVVATLASPPPLPLEVVREPIRAIAGPRRRPRPAPRVLLAAAAGLLLAVFVVPKLLPTDPLSRLPEAPLYRGQQEAGLLFPRGPVLARGEGVAAPSFLLSEIEGATEYRVEVFQHGGGAFDAGTSVASLRSLEPTLSGGPLEPGHYTWRAWATVQGLQRDLGDHEFEVRADGDLTSRIDGLGEDASIAEIVEVIRVLDQAGYLTDARELARTLPEGPRRDAYLRPPGR